MVRLNILKERQQCSCGGNCKCNNNKSKKINKAMDSFFSSMKRNTQDK